MLLLGFLALGLLLAYLLKASFDSTLRQTTDDAENLVQILDGQLGATLRRLDASLHAIATELPRAALQAAAVPRYQPQVAAILRRHAEKFPELGGFYLWDARGESLYDSHWAAVAPRQRRSIAQREGYLQLRDDPTLTIAFSESIRGVVSGQLTVAVYVPVRDAAGRLQAVLSGTLNLAHFERVFRALQLSPGSVVFVRSTTDHKLVLRYPMLESEFNRPVRNRLQQRIDAGEKSGRDRFQAATDGQSRLYGFRRIDQYPFYVVVGLSEAGALLTWYQEAFFVAGAITLLAIVLVLLLWRMRQIEAEREAARLEADKALQLLHEAVKSIHVGFTIYDEQDRLVICNEAHLEMHRSTRDLLVPGRSFEDILRQGALRGQYVQAVGQVEAWVQTRLQQHREADGRTYEQAMGDGRWLLVSEHRTPSGFVVGSRVDITERKKLEAELLEQATTDALTGLPNRRQFLQRLEEELERVRRGTTREACALMLDLDHFKRINDGHGHAAGDSLLRHFANILSAELRAADTAGRMGGEEFAVILPGTGEQAACGFSERVRARLAAQPLTFGEHKVLVTVSIGIAAIAVDDLSSDAVLSRADAALYQAKNSGRNQVRIALH